MHTSSIVGTYEYVLLLGRYLVLESVPFALRLAPKETERKNRDMIHASFTKTQTQTSHRWALQSYSTEGEKYRIWLAFRYIKCSTNAPHKQQSTCIIVVTCTNNRHVWLGTPPSFVYRSRILSHYIKAARRVNPKYCTHHTTVLFWVLQKWASSSARSIPGMTTVNTETFYAPYPAQNTNRCQNVRCVCTPIFIIYRA